LEVISMTDTTEADTNAGRAGRPWAVRFDDGHEVRLSSQQAEAIDVILRAPETVSPREAAELLGVSRPMVVRWIDEGLLADVPKGAHHRIPMESVLALKAVRAEAGRAAVAEVVESSTDPAAARRVASARSRAEDRIANRNANR
jgi:excisionase family DNA binding protein